MAKQSKYQWSLKQDISQQLIDLFQENVNVSNVMATLCLQRGINTKDDFEKFVHPTLDQLHDPYLMYDMAKGVERIKTAIEMGEHILIYGDYDADGITSVAILYETLESLGADVTYYLPNRFIDGYGPNAQVFTYMIEQEGVNLIITCDNGVAGYDPIQLAMDKGVDVIVTDHHEIPSQLPNAYAIIHPRHPNGQYPFGELSGAGVAFKLASALLDEIPMELLEVVAIGTIADVVPLVDENRVLVQHGIAQLKHTQRIGLIKLLESNGLDASSITSESVAFSIAPCLNAIGRLDDAMPGVVLLTTFDDEEANIICQYIQKKNDERKQLVQTIVEDVFSQIKEPYDSVIMLANPNWHAGVLGIVASKVVEQTNRPTILLQIDATTNTAKGSGRSIKSVNLFEELTKVKDLLVKFGGHDMAAGLTIDVNNIDTVLNVLNDNIAIHNKKEYQADMVISTNDVTVDLLHELKQFEPYGNGNEKPKFIMTASQLKQVKTIGDKQQHIKGQINQLDFIQFNGAQYKSYLNVGATVQFLGQVSLNEWNSIEKPQLIVIDSKIEDMQIFDYRATRIKKSDTQIENATYIFFQDNFYHYFKDKIVNSSYSVLAKDIVEPLTIENVVFFDCPNTIEELDRLLYLLTIDNIYMMWHTKDNAYLYGLPTREQFSQLYKIIYAQKQLNVKEDLEKLAKQLSIKKEMVILMLQVFFEVKFVTIEGAFVLLNANHNKVDLYQTKSINQYEQKMKVQKQLLFTNYNVISQYIKQKNHKKEEI